MYFYQRNLTDLEFTLGKIDDWIIDLKEQTAEINDIEAYTKELYDIMYEFDKIGENLQAMVQFIESAKELDI